jgi:hypothetical protein
MVKHSPVFFMIPCKLDIDATMRLETYFHSVKMFNEF